MKIFIDSNIIISAILFPNGEVSKVFSHILKKDEIIISDYCINECREVFKRKFPNKIKALELFFSQITYKEFKTPTSIKSEDFPNIRDEKDLPVLASAILSSSDVILTGDKDFKDINLKYPIVFTPKEYKSIILK